MKKIIISFVLLAFITLCCTQAFSQMEKGTRFINASLTGIDFSKWDIKPDGGDESLEISQFGLNLSGGQFLNENLALKVSLGYLSTGLSVDGDDMVDLRAFIGMAGVRYQLESGWFFGGGLGLSSFTLEPAGDSETKFKATMLGLEGGYAFFLSDRIAIEPSLIFNKSLSTEVELGEDDFDWKTDPNDNDKIEFDLTQIGFSIGITIFL